MKLLISLSLLLLLNSSCEDIISLRVSEHPPFITVNCILKEGEPIYMEINSSQPYPPLIDSTLTIKDATVKLFEDGVYIEDLVYKESSMPLRELLYRHAPFRYYNSLNRFTPQLDHYYSISVTAPGFEEVSSGISIPKPVPVISVDTSTVYVKSGRYTFKSLECSIKLNDPPGERNYYKLNITRKGLYKECINWGMNCSTKEIDKMDIAFFCNDLNAVYFQRPTGSVGSIGLEPDFEEEKLLTSIFIADDSFDGTKYELKVFIPIDFLVDFADSPIPGEKYSLRKINFELSSVNEEYYKYARSNFIQVLKKNDMFSEPVYVYSNIKKGGGIFSGSSASVDSSILMPVYYRTAYY